ncbi:MAG TPA: DNA/RNA helicase domain-containing protein [Acidobacteriaceae bacterium]|nr:DNA/RNA helicase domain-containing protein [Acidobacteriaceae bacterium]
MASFYIASVEEFLAQSEGEVLAHLATGYAKRGYTQQYSDQTLTWEHDIRSLRAALGDCVASDVNARSWELLLEFSIPRKELRIDAVLLVGDTIIILEAKTSKAALLAKRQAEEYALLLHYFHKDSDRRTIVPILLSPNTPDPSLDSLVQHEMFQQVHQYWVKPVLKCSWEFLPFLLLKVATSSGNQISGATWDQSPYHPVPNIIEAALALKTGLAIKEIAHSEASEHEIDAVCEALQRYVDDAHTNKLHAICFLTGVPGSGKTLVGLTLAHSADNKASSVHFMSGNGPLVTVLQHLFTQESRRNGASAPQARTEARTLIENVHVFARNYTEDDSNRPPSNHAIIFDEAQRAWNKTQNLKKFKRDYSEPEMLLSIMGRHSDWAVVIALVGGGQEINDGEAGLEEWGRALSASQTNWTVYASPEVIDGGESTAGRRLFTDTEGSSRVVTNPALHLRTSNRSLRAERLATWVNLVLDGEARKAAELRITDRFPIFLSRDLNETRHALRRQRLGAIRYGLVGSSNAARLRSEGLEPNSAFHANYPWEHWYLSDELDIRSSYQCEVFATEFEIQGLELDWIGLCWGGDFVWDHKKGWQIRRLQLGSPTKWNPIKNLEKRTYRKNAYRVLLTRARQGMVIFVPRGDSNDASNSPEEFDSTANFLVECGVLPLTTSV